MNNFSNVDQTLAFSTVSEPAHVCEELLELHGIDFHENPPHVFFFTQPSCSGSNIGNGLKVRQIAKQLQR